MTDDLNETREFASTTKKSPKLTTEERELALIKSHPGFEAKPFNKTLYSAAHKEKMLNGLT
jgi:hypothetical protein